MIMCPLTLPFFTPKNKKEDEKYLQELKEIEDKIKNIPITYRYYCSYCGYQTNERTKRCPKCRKGRLVETQPVKEHGGGDEKEKNIDR